MAIRILVADDDPDISMSLSERLRWLGHEVVTAADGQAALAAVEAHALDLAFLDVSMPRLNGIEALKLIRKRWPNLPVVVVTAYGTIRLAVEAMKEGAVDFITKPFEQGQIDQTVSTFIDRMGQRVEITKLMGEITHDVKNLLMPLVTGTDLLADEIDDVFRHLPAMERSRAEQSHSNCEEVITMFRNTSRRIQDRMKAIADYAAVTRVSQKFEHCAWRDCKDCRRSLETKRACTHCSIISSIMRSPRCRLTASSRSTGSTSPGTIAFGCACRIRAMAWLQKYATICSRIVW